MNKSNLSLVEKMPFAILIIGLIAGIIFGFLIPSIDIESFEQSFNFVLMLIIWIIFGISSIVFLAISEHLNGLSKIEDEITKIRHIIEDKQDN